MDKFYLSKLEDSDGERFFFEKIFFGNNFLTILWYDENIQVVR